MVKLIIEADLTEEELQVLIDEVTILHRDIFDKQLVLQLGQKDCDHNWVSSVAYKGARVCSKCSAYR